MVLKFSTCIAGAELLRAEGVKVRIVSAPSEGLFRCQSVEYQESVLPKNAKIFGLTAGLPVTLQGLVGANGTVYGLNSFGFSAPYKVLDEKLGFTAQNVYEQVKFIFSITLTEPCRISARLLNDFNAYGNKNSRYCLRSRWPSIKEICYSVS